MEGNKIPWREGFWKMGSMKSMILQVGKCNMAKIFLLCYSLLWVITTPDFNLKFYFRLDKWVKYEVEEFGCLGLS